MEVSKLNVSVIRNRSKAMKRKSTAKSLVKRKKVSTMREK